MIAVGKAASNRWIWGLLSCGPLRGACQCMARAFGWKGSFWEARVEGFKRCTESGVMSRLVDILNQV